MTYEGSSPYIRTTWQPGTHGSTPPKQYPPRQCDTCGRLLSRYNKYAECMHHHDGREVPR